MTLWTGSRPLILASQSESRRALLTGAGLPVVVMASGVDERVAEAPLRTIGAKAAEVAQYLARAKAWAVSRLHRDDLVLGADQVLVLDGRLFTKPSNKSQAAAQLEQLSGRTHQLHAAFSLIRGEGILAEHVAVATMTMRQFDATFIDRYLDAAGEAVFGSVGAYQLEGLGIHLFDQVEGDHSTILGLPLLPVLAALRSQGVLA